MHLDLVLRLLLLAREATVAALQATLEGQVTGDVHVVLAVNVVHEYRRAPVAFVLLFYVVECLLVLQAGPVCPEHAPADGAIKRHYFFIQSSIEE